MLPLGCEAAPKRPPHSVRDTQCAEFATAAQSSGSKLLRHSYRSDDKSVSADQLPVFCGFNQPRTRRNNCSCSAALLPGKVLSAS
ncbi:hypothetical protein C1Y08_15425 [Pseudomonas sp. FW306-02-F02-AA]|nr:hypothetical protein C1Y07_27590 [Pseudomonas sp. FW306-02-F02-AB]PMZ09552.1 hypothetical protein C1Y06_14005 [Pseudomonas sp. FW306-02-H06C]PMZ15135.1 hypothetical protein C1Y08_15425 [Pseudomonas sp. FW306-02-F02-AA]PMZ23505.1 hypothetical protein C1Y09_01575 [Pseudomonas sp. FW306-02-F08-AA]PMZ26593.1 hypothetical protein C1Y05_17935 [Pseudomonas sp. FW306-02-F04-BA]PMZ34232.1 hypothetical protein C1X99_12720 [Pseudomonas sp. FW306-02-H06B]PMZ41972.1 hypothetical protein C1Y00_02205 [Ps